MNFVIMPQVVNSNNNSDTESGNGVPTRLATLRNINQNRRSDQKQAANPEEQIIKSRGRRELPRTPVRKSPRKRNFIAGDNSKDSASNQPLLQESPFTKCIRSMDQSPPRPAEHRIGSTIRKRLLMSPVASTSGEFSLLSSGTSVANKSLKKIHYYSPISRKLRSSDASEIANLCLDDSGVDLTSPNVSVDLTTQSTLNLLAMAPDGDNISVKSVASSVPSCSSRKTATSINRARRRFRF